MNQVKMNRCLRKMEADPSFEGSGRYEKLLVRINTGFAIVFTLDEVPTSTSMIALPVPNAPCTGH